MKKILFVFVLVAIIATGTAFASPVHPGGLGIGALWAGHFGGGGIGHGAALSLKLPSLPVFWGISWYGGAVGVQGDVYLMGSNLLPFMGWYLGVGGYGSFYLGDDAVIGLGVRLPIGLTFQFINLLELFIDVAPSLGISFWTYGDGGSSFPNWGYPIEIGIRIWL